MAEPALLLGVGVAAALAGEEAAVQALPFGGLQEPVGLQAVGTVGVAQEGRVRNQLPLGALLLHLALQAPEETAETRSTLDISLQQPLNV